MPFYFKKILFYFDLSVTDILFGYYFSPQVLEYNYKVNVKSDQF